MLTLSNIKITLTQRLCDTESV